MCLAFCSLIKSVDIAKRDVERIQNVHMNCSINQWTIRTALTKQGSELNLQPCSIFDFPARPDFRLSTHNSGLPRGQAALRIMSEYARRKIEDITLRARVGWLEASDVYWYLRYSQEAGIEVRKVPANLPQSKCFGVRKPTLRMVFAVHKLDCMDLPGSLPREWIIPSYRAFLPPLERL